MGGGRDLVPGRFEQARREVIPMMSLALVQVGASPEWVGPTIVVAIAVLKISGQAKKISALVDGLQGDIAGALNAVRRLTEQGQDVMVVIRQEAGAFAQTARRLRRKIVRAIDEVEVKLEELETLYDVVHDEVENAALDVATALRRVRRGNGMLGRVRRLLVPSR
jgi:hypothetical protein